MERISNSIFEGIDDEILNESGSSKEGFIVKCSQANSDITSKCDIKGVSCIDDGLKSKSAPVVFHCDNVKSLCDLVKTLAENLKSPALFNSKPSINITLAATSSINDSLHEAKKTSFTPSMHYKGDTPRSYHKRVLLDQIRHRNIERNVETISQYLVDNGVWDENTSEKRKLRDIQDILDKSEGFDVDMKGDFVTDFIYCSEDAYNSRTGETMSRQECVDRVVQYLRDNGLDVKTEQRTYSDLIFIHYSDRLQYECLVKWLLWHLGISNNIQSGGLKSFGRKEIEDVIASGHFCTWHYSDVYKDGEEDLDISSLFIDNDEDEE